MEVVRILVNDFDTCFRFYSETLGLKVIWGELGNVYASFDNGYGAEIGLFSSNLMAEFIGNSDKSLSSNTREKVMITLCVKNVDEVYEKLKNNGVKFINTPVTMQDWGMRMVHLRDPEDNLVEFYTPLQM